MIDFELTPNCREMRYELASRLDARDFVQDKSGVRLIEVYGASFVADEVTLFGDVNYDWCERELAWYKSMSRSVNDIPPPVPAIWKQVADRDGLINSNYGWMLWSGENGFQWNCVVEELIKNPSSRRAVAIYTRPSMWNEYDVNGRSDFCCTNAVQYVVRNGQMHAIVQMRSNDAVFGYKGDRFWQAYALRTVADAVGVPMGTITWQAGSLHVYERHFYLVDHWAKTGETHVKKAEYEGEWQ